MGAFNVSLTLNQGETFSRNFTWKIGPAATAVPVDLTGCTARMQVRPVVKSATVLLELTTENGRIALGGVAGTPFACSA